MYITSYDPKKVNVNIDGTMLTGFASDGIITVSKNEDAVTPNVGCQGDVVYEENANESGTIAITLQQPPLPFQSFGAWRRTVSSFRCLFQMQTMMTASVSVHRGVGLQSFRTFPVERIQEP